MASSWPWAELVRHDEMISGLARAVEASPRFRWLEVCCSLASGRGDEHSDVDAGVGYGDDIDVDAGALEAMGSALVRSLGPITDMLAHVLPGWPIEARRFAVEFENDLQLDLALLPASRRIGLPTGAVAIVDKDNRLASPWQPRVQGPPSAEEAREWLMLGSWALSDTAKYIARRSLFEAVDRLVEARHQALKLYAVGRQAPFPSFGLVSLLDFPPYEVPDGLARTYATPTTLREGGSAAIAIADLLEEAARSAGDVLGADLATPWTSSARRRLAQAAMLTESPRRRGRRRRRP